MIRHDCNYRRTFWEASYNLTDWHYSCVKYVAQQQKPHDRSSVLQNCSETFYESDDILVFHIKPDIR